MFALTEIQKRAVFNWVSNELNMYTVFAGQEGEKPARPYAIIHMLTAPASQYISPSRKGVSPILKEYYYSEVFTLSIMVKDDTDAMYYCNMLGKSVDKSSVKALLHQAGLYPKYCYPPILTDNKTYFKLPTKIEYTAIIDIVFGRSNSFEESRDIITDVEITYEED